MTFSPSVDHNATRPMLLGAEGGFLAGSNFDRLLFAAL